MRGSTQVTLAKPKNDTMDFNTFILDIFPTLSFSLPHVTGDGLDNGPFVDMA